MQVLPAEGTMRQAVPVDKRRSTGQWALRLIAIGLLAAALALNYWMWLAPDSGFNYIRHLHTQIDRQNQQNSRLEVRNNAIKADIESLRQGLDAIEERARSNLNMIREGETLFRIIEPDSDAVADPNAATDARAK
jgi:cell division protein FtsB